MCERIDPVFQENFPSSEMASYLAGCALIREDIRGAVAYAPIPLKRKRNLFLQPASGKDTAYFHRQAACIMFGLCAGRMKRTVTEEQILSYIRSKTNT